MGEKSRIDLIKELEIKAKKLRVDALSMIYKAQSGHPGGSFSSIDILIGLYNYKLKINPKNPKWDKRDRFIMSKGHASPAVYAVLGDLGFFHKKEFNNFRQLGGLLQGHVDAKIPGVEMSTGSLGQGLSFGNGICFARELDKKNYGVYVLMGDGEVQEGQVWEAAMTASHYGLNITAILDRNRIQNDGFVKDTMVIEPLKDKWESFGWHVVEINGHDFNEILDTLDELEKIKGPKIIIAHTVKGKGVSFMENNPSFHGKAPNEEEMKIALKELGE
ncbi:transketolase [Candidatus Woesearchaeota archaeon]|nr:transketolase [Candidatus Woesearchaeota archaeon]